MNKNIIVKNMGSDIKLVAGTSHPELAAEVSAWLGIPLSGRDIVRFPNENIFVRLHETVRGQDVYVIQSMSPPVSDNIMEMLITIDCLRRASAERITAVFPYMAYARSDKKDQPRVPISAKMIASMISSAGADRYITVDLHAGQIQGFFDIPGDELTAFHLMVDYLKKKNLDDVVIVSTDLGFAKKARNFAAELDTPMAIVEKRRMGNTMQSEALSLIGEVTGKTTIVVDEEILTAGSIANAVQVVREHGAKDVYICCTHAAFTDAGVEKLRGLDVKEIITTNTLPIPPSRRLPNLVALSIAPLIGEVIRRVHEGKSVGEMFDE